MPIATCLRKDQIPARYSGMPLLGRGATSIALARNDGGVLMLTRDRLKMEWLRDGLQMGDVIDEFETRGHHIPGMDELPAWAVVLPRLVPLSPTARKEVNSALREFQEARISAMSRNSRLRGGQDRDRTAQDLSNWYAERPDSLLTPLFSWLANYNAADYHLDLGRRNFMSDATGNPVVLDPIVSADLMTLIAERRRRAEPVAALRW